MDVLSKLRGVKRNGSGWIARCPVPGHQHDDRNPSLSISYRDEKLLLHCFGGHRFKEIMDELGGCAANQKVVLLKGASKVDPAERNAYLRRLWRESRPARGSLVEKYLRSRGITISVPYSLRFHPRLRHAPSNTCWPAMIAAVVSIDRKLIAIHRTYLSPDGTGKADVDCNKMALGPIKGGAVRLGGFDIPTKLAIAEGVETALSVQQGAELPTWATLGTEFMKAVVVPAQVGDVVICADADEPGEEAARTLANRLVAEGLPSVKIARPKKGYKDFNDMLRG